MRSKDLSKELRDTAAAGQGYGIFQFSFFNYFAEMS